MDVNNQTHTPQVSDFDPDRRRKLDQMRALGIDPFPAAAFLPGHAPAEIQADAESLIANGATVRVAGRIVRENPLGGTVFMDIQDCGARVQAMFRRNGLAATEWAVMPLLDVGDFIGVEGTVMRTRVGEVTVDVRQLTVLGKAAQAMPIGKQTRDGAFHDALADGGALARQRHVAMQVNPEFRTRMILRHQIIRGIRDYFDGLGFTEVSTPLMVSAYGGAAAKPFSTHVNALDQDMYLRVSPESNLKRVLCGGLNAIYEIGQNFRNEGIDATHNPEFTMMEWYEAYTSYEEQMVHFETLVPQVAERVTGSTRISFRGHTIDLAEPWLRLPVIDALREETGLDLREVPAADMTAIFTECHPLGASALSPDSSWGQAVIRLFEALIEPRLIQPTFVMDHPVDVSPLTKRHRADDRLVERFEPFIGGMEIGNSYSELNDPWEQWERLACQQGDREDHYDLDYDFIHAMAHGMPQAGGSGLGIDRLVMLLTGANSIKEAMLFPLVSSARVAGN